MNKVNPIHYYIHEYDFEYSELLQPHIESFIEIFDQYVKDKYLKTNNLILPNIPVIQALETNLHNLIITNYYAGPHAVDSRINLYIQDNTVNEKRLRFHNHMDSPGNLSLVFYMNIPEENGEISFKFFPYEEDFKIKPKLNKVYVFPSWVYHKPNKHEDNINRLCFNWIYPGNIRPIHKILGNLW